MIFIPSLYHKAERNVLPTLNNLLENREMSLEDGRFLMKEEMIAAADATSSSSSISANQDDRLVKVHPAFRVIALGHPVPPYSGRTLDPPLRSRFQGKFIDDLSAEALLSCLDVNGVSKTNLQAIINFYESIRALRAAAIAGNTSISSIATIPSFSYDRLTHCLNLLREYPTMPAVHAVGRSFPLGCLLNGQTSGIGHKIFPSVISNATRLIGAGEELDSEYNEAFWTGEALPNLTRQQSILSERLRQDLLVGSSCCLFGPKGSGKSHVVNQTLSRFSSKIPRLFPLYQELTSRDFLARRSTATNEVTGEVRDSKIPY